MNKKLIYSVIIAVVIIILGFVLFNKPEQNDKEVEALAKCLTEKGAKMYGLPTCSHCIAQKELFGDYFKEIDYTDCSATPEACAGIQFVPTWKINGKEYSGTQGLEILKQLAGC